MWAAVAAIASVAIPAHSRQTPAPPAIESPRNVPPVTPRQSDTPAAGGLSPRNANYDLDVALDPSTRTLTGSGVIRWRNLGTGPADSLRLHLYWNAWRDASSTWMREEALPSGSPATLLAADAASIDLTSLAMASADGSAGRDLMPALSFVQPDDGNRADQTLAAVALPAPVGPGAEITLRVGWTARVPRTVARTGAVGDYFFIAHWFPKIAVFEGDQWVAHQFHANTEFYSDYGVYNVRMTVPTGWIVGATGTEVSQRAGSSGTTTHHYAQADVHDFAWTTSPDYIEHRQRFDHPGLPAVDIRLLMQPEHAGQEDRHMAATVAALRYYGEWYGAYPYPQITVIDPAYQSGAGGMEYPTLFTAGTRWLAPRHSNTPEAVTVHEAGHQFWYAMVGNNEFDHAWMDEGFNTFSEERVQSLAFQPNYRVERFFGGFVPWQYRDIALRRDTDGNGLNGYRSSAERDDPSTSSFRYWPGTHANITYSKTALWLHTLERHLGWEVLQRILSTYFERWRFRHPRPEDFFSVANEVSGTDLTWFFDQVHRSSNTFDYAIETVSNHSDRTTVVVRRLGEAIFPIDVVTTFDDGQQVREQWDGRDRWRQFTYTRGVEATTVQIDPDRVLLLDVNYTNNSWTRTPQADAAADKWSLKWMVWCQDLLLTWAFLV